MSFSRDSHRGALPRSPLSAPGSAGTLLLSVGPPNCHGAKHTAFISRQSRKEGEPPIQAGIPETALRALLQGWTQSKDFFRQHRVFSEGIS